MRLGETQSILLPKGALASGWLLRAWASKALKPSRDGGSTTTQGELSGLFMEKFLPILTLNLSFQLQEIASCLPILHHCEKSHSISSTTLWWCWGLLSTPKLSLFPADPDQLPQSLLTGQVLQPCHPGSPPLSSLQFVHVFPLLGSKAGLSIWMWCGVPHRGGRSLSLTFEPYPWSQFRSCLCCQSSPQWCWADCPLWPQGCTAELLPSPILWQCHCRGSSFPGAKKVSASRKNASEPFGYIILTTSVNKEWRCFYHI